MLLAPSSTASLGGAGPSVSLGIGRGPGEDLPHSLGAWVSRGTVQTRVKAEVILETPPHEHKLSSCPLSCQVLSPLAKNLFHRAISESGVALTAALVRKDMKEIAQVGRTQDHCHTLGSAVLESSGAFLDMGSGRHPQGIMEVTAVECKGKETPRPVSQFYQSWDLNT